MSVPELSTVETPAPDQTPGHHQTPAPDPMTRWGVVTVLVLIGTVAAAQMYKLAPSLPLLRQDLGISLVAGGWLFSLSNLLAAVIGVATGLLADRLGHRRVLIGGLVAFVVANMVAAWTDSIGVLFACRILEGYGFLSVVIAVASLIVQETAPEDRAAALAFWGTYNPLGGTIILLAAPLILNTAGWRWLWLVLAAVTVAALVVFLSIKPRAAATKPLIPQNTLSLRRSLSYAVANPGAWCTGLAFGLYAMQFMVVMSWLPTALVEQHGLTVRTASVMTAVVLSVNILGSLAAGRLLKRRIRHGLLIAATAAVMAVMAVMIFSELPNLLRYLACIGLSLVGGILPGTVFAAAPVIAPSPLQIGAVNGMNVQGSNAGILIGPPLAAWIVAHSGQWNSLLGLFLVASTLVFGLGVWLARIEHAGRVK